MSDPTDPSELGGETLPLLRPYTARPGTPTVDRVEIDIFRESYFRDCLDCTFCHDSCCQYGACVGRAKVEAILARADELEPLIGRPRDEWFQDWWEPDEGFPGGAYTRTQVTDGACVFLNRRGRGCLLHSFALEKGLPVHDIKPMVCNTFPVEIWDRVLVVPVEVEDRSLVCVGQGPSLYRSARPDLEAYFGPEMVAELDALEAKVLAEHPPTPVASTTSLPVIPVWRAG